MSYVHTKSILLATIIAVATACADNTCTSAAKDSLQTDDTSPAPDMVGHDVLPAALEFPPEFRFGASTAAHQVEGGQKNSWTLWETLDYSKQFVAEPSGKATDHYNRYVEDLDLVQWMGLDVYRLSIEWSRIEPEKGVYNDDEVEHYKAVFEAMKKRGIRPSVTLHHFTEPQWFTDLTKLSQPVNDSFCPSGPSDTDFCFWSNPDAPEVFAAFCGLAAQEYGQYVDEWMTFNELSGYWIQSTVMGDFPPGLTAPTMDEVNQLALPVLKGLLASHAACYKAIHENDTVDADGDGVNARVGLTTGTGAVYPADKDNPDDVAAAQQGKSLATFLVFDAVNDGKLDADFDGMPEEEHPEWADTLDLLGLQYYASTVIVGMQVHPLLLGAPCTNVEDEILMALQILAGCPPPPTPDFPMGDEPPEQVWGRQHDPQGLLQVLGDLHERYPQLPIVITENGYANHDVKRAGSLVRHLDACHQALEAGIPLEGYYHWSLLDNFEWGHGFAVRFGLVRVDYDTLKRTPTIAAEVYREITGARGLTAGLLQAYGGSGVLPVEGEHF